MSTIVKTAKAFVQGKRASCHNASTDGEVYRLHGHPIAVKNDDGEISFNWCGWYTRTTANHMNHILNVLNASVKVYYAKDRNAGILTFTYESQNA